MARRSHLSRFPRILALGRDFSLLSSEANLLTQAGYNADLIPDVAQAVSRARLQQYHLAIVTTTFTYDEQIAIRARLKRVSQGLPVLLLNPEHDSPDAFLAAVADSLRQKTTFQFGTRTEDFFAHRGAQRAS
jgi:DNA-binding response OmpR family regulator